MNEFECTSPFETNWCISVNKKRLIVGVSLFILSLGDAACIWFFFYLSCFGGHVIWSKSYWRELQYNYLINLFWHSLMFIKIFYIYNYNYCTVKYTNIGFTSIHLPLWEFRLFWRILWHLSYSLFFIRFSLLFFTPILWSISVADMLSSVMYESKLFFLELQGVFEKACSVVGESG